ncbi:DUF551 domain-containing protein [Cronobacter sakazakii]|uniref:DUF551 domain-containing protein n=1 Tax=Cronobacter sakazakii TaxID=28141 RepID=UPI0021AB61E8|nr:DUF551 domain-containing protein [Cronobacter sakazakii]
MSEISKVIASEIADFFAGFGGPGEPDIQIGEAQRLLTERLLSVLALRERAEPVVCQKCGNTGLADSGGVQPWGEPILIECDCTAPPAPGADDDSLPYDPQIAEYEQMMEAEQAQADTTAQEYPETLPCPVILEPNFRFGKGVRTATMLRALQTRAEHQAELDSMTPEGRADYEARMDAFKAMLSSSSQTTLGKEIEQALKGNLHKLYLDDETDNSESLAQAETDTTSQQFESLEGKAVSGSEGFECTPVADLYELLTKCGECYDYTTSAKVAADWIKEGYSAREYVKLDRLQEAMTQGSPGEADGWIPCSERMPDDGVSVLAYCKCGDNFSGIYTMRAPVIRSKNSRKDDSVVHHERVTHWMPLPAAPGKEG